MKKRKQIKIPKYAFGLDMLGPMASVTGTLDSATAPGADEPPSTANGAVKVLGGAASGAAAGAALGPIGAIGGAVIGGVIGIFGAKKAKRDYEKKVAAAKEKRRVYDNTTNFNAAVANSNNIQKEYEGDAEKAYTFANGGVILRNPKKQQSYVAKNESTTVVPIIKDSGIHPDKNAWYSFMKENPKIAAAYDLVNIGLYAAAPLTGGATAIPAAVMSGIQGVAGVDDMLNNGVNTTNALDAANLLTLGVSGATKAAKATGVTLKVKQGTRTAKDVKRVIHRSSNAASNLIDSGQLGSDAVELYESDKVKKYANGGMIKNKKKTNVSAYAYGKAKKCANGGAIDDSQLAYVDDGEVIRTPDGNITEVPEQGQAEDANLVNLPEYSTILSDKLKIKALGGKTPAQYFKSKQGKVSDSTDEYAANSTRLNKQNNEKLYAKLLDIQHVENVKLGNKQQSKSIPKYAKGKGAVTTPNPTATVMPVYKEQTTKAPVFGNPYASSPTIPNKLPSNALVKRAIIDQNAMNMENAKKRLNAQSGSKFNLGNVDFGSIAALSAPLYNIAKSREAVEEVEPIENPYAGSIISASNELSNRRYNINPIIEANRRTRNISNYNASQANTNTGASMAMRTQNAVNEYAANADLYATKNNTENQWASEGVNARMNAYSQLGQQSIAAQSQAQQINRQAQAKQDDYRAAGYTQLGEWGQMQQKYRNQRRSENIGWEAMNKFLSQGYTQDEMARINALYGKR